MGGDILAETFAENADLVGQLRSYVKTHAMLENLGVTRKALSDLLNGHSGMSPEMALRLEKAGWSTAEAWLCMQMNWSLWRVRQQAGKIKVRKFRQPVPT